MILRNGLRIEQLCEYPSLWQRIKDRFWGIKWEKLEGKEEIET